jgi:hypothetical protein
MHFYTLLRSEICAFVQLMLRAEILTPRKKNPQLASGRKVECKHASHDGVQPVTDVVEARSSLWRDLHSLRQLHKRKQKMII